MGNPKTTTLLEFETMLLGRYSLSSARTGHLDRSAYTLLSRLHMGGPMSISQLSEALGLDTSTVNRQTAAMRRAGLLDRIPDPDGGIARKFQISAEGTRQLEAHRADSVQHLDVILADWSPEDLSALVGYLERFNTDIERYHGRPWPRE
ncbi:MarR family winged helix-turn-helix transcriptional regulator [Nocardia alni]|uniref:MarR family winged helix-turn-helix transcriptional regulator n=1 Tax=Nocardia alni TaxID=2815723 RepID=UPI0027DECAE5|nr:MarR family transcriptional regulator [Nocardia alni]